VACVPHRRLERPGLRLPRLDRAAVALHVLVNSLAHVMGRRRYATTDTSRNSALIAFLTMGEGWHNNHHYYQASARQGFFWWEFDVSYYILKSLSWVGVVRDLKEPPARVKTAARIRDGQFDMGMFKAHWARAGASLAQRADQRPRRRRQSIPSCSSPRPRVGHPPRAARGAHRRPTGRPERARRRTPWPTPKSSAASAAAPSARSARSTDRATGPVRTGPTRAGPTRDLLEPGGAYSRPFSSLVRAASSVTLRAKLSSDTRMPRARSSMDFSAVDRPLPFSRSARFRTTSATW
jgi:hypothetical protein